MTTTLVKNKENLPVKMEDLQRFIIIGKEALNAQKAKIRAIKKTDDASDAYHAALSDGQDVAEIVIDAEVKLGEILAGIDKRKSYTGFQERNPVLPPGIDKKTSHQAQVIKRNPKIVEQAKAAARKSGVLITAAKIISTVKQSEREKRLQEQQGAIKDLKPAKGKYSIISIDPPWPYGTKYDSDARRAASPYPEMSIEELREIELPAQDDCILWLWTTHKFLWDAKDLMDAWGFEYKALMVWNKEKMGLGHWLRMQCEFCLLGIKGKPEWGVCDLRDIWTEARSEHSAKPDGWYEEIRKALPGSRYEYFSGAGKREGWVPYGQSAR